jgi:NADPH:quinone reductase-like Zn-dependent oxidoreductase
MRAVRVHQFGGLEAIVSEEVTRPVPGEGQALVRVKAAGVGPWDAWVRVGRSVIPQTLPLVLGADLAGVIQEVGPAVRDLHPGRSVLFRVCCRSGSWPVTLRCWITSCGPGPKAGWNVCSTNALWKPVSLSQERSVAVSLNG